MAGSDTPNQAPGLRHDSALAAEPFLADDDMVDLDLAETAADLAADYELQHGTAHRPLTTQAGAGTSSAAPTAQAPSTAQMPNRGQATSTAPAASTAPATAAPAAATRAATNTPPAAAAGFGSQHRGAAAPSRPTAASLAAGTRIEGTPGPTARVGSNTGGGAGVDQVDHVDWSPNPGSAPTQAAAAITTRPVANPGSGSGAGSGGEPAGAWKGGGLDRQLSPVVDAVLETLPAATVRTVRQGPTAQTLSRLRGARKRRFEERNIAAAPGAGSIPSRGVEGAATYDQTMVSQKTMEAYLHRGHQLMERYRRERGLGDVEHTELPLIDWVNWLLSMKPRIKSNTWRVYRQAAMFHLGRLPVEEVDAALGMLANDVVDRSRDALSGDRNPFGEDAETLAARKEKRGSAKKEKRFKQDDFEAVLLRLQRFSRSERAESLSLWLRASVLVGLRPAEWQATDLEVVEDARAAFGRRAWLYVINAKATNGRGTGISRTLDLSAFPDEQLDTVRRMSSLARSWTEAGTFAHEQHACSALLYKLTEAMWPKRRYGYALYSTRHQFIANLKSLGISIEEIATMVGHGSTATATERYGKKTAGWKPSAIAAPPRPVPEELAHVRRQRQLFEERQELERRARVRTPTMPFALG